MADQNGYVEFLEVCNPKAPKRMVSIDLVARLGGRVGMSVPPTGNHPSD
jgi:hypothetical protein